MKGKTNMANGFNIATAGSKLREQLIQYKELAKYPNAKLKPYKKKDLAD